MFDAQRLRQLQALGVVPMRLRGQVAVEVVEELPQRGAESAGPATGVVLQLWFASGEGDPFTGAHGRLLTQILKSLDLCPEQTRVRSRHEAESQEDDALPLLAFGPGAPAGAIRLAALEKLRDPIEKRIAWPLLRGLRRVLRRAMSEVRG